MKQIVQFGSISGSDRRRFADARGARGPAARGADRDLGSRLVLEAAGRSSCRAFVAATRQKSGKVPTASTWLDFVAVRTYALVANQEKTLDAVKLAKALGGFALPPEVALIPGKPYYRAADHQMVATSLYVGHAQPQGDEPEDLFHVDDVIDELACSTRSEDRLHDEVEHLAASFQSCALSKRPAGL